MLGSIVLKGFVAGVAPAFGSRGEQFRQFSEIERSHIEGELCPDIGHAAQHRLGDLADRSMAEPLTLAATCGVTHMRRKTAMKSEAS